jgi:hypothetical protein
VNWRLEVAGTKLSMKVKQNGNASSHQFITARLRPINLHSVMIMFLGSARSTALQLNDLDNDD